MDGLRGRYYIHCDTFRVAQHGYCSNRERFLIVGFHCSLGTHGQEFTFPTGEFDDKCGAIESSAELQAAVVAGARSHGGKQGSTGFSTGGAATAAGAAGAADPGSSTPLTEVQDCRHCSSRWSSWCRCSSGGRTMGATTPTTTVVVAAIVAAVEVATATVATTGAETTTAKTRTPVFGALASSAGHQVSRSPQ